jgi:hypothetical protein
MKLLFIHTSTAGHGRAGRALAEVTCLHKALEVFG